LLGLWGNLVILAALQRTRHIPGIRNAERFSPSTIEFLRQTSVWLAYRGNSLMKNKTLPFLILTFVSFAVAKDKKIHESGTLLRMEAVECGYDENSGKSFAGELLGTDSAHKKTRALLCQEYVLQSEHITYRIRPRDEKHPVLLPVGTRAQFRMDKDKMKLQVEDMDSKERDYSVVSMTQRDEGTKDLAHKY
jgi:hypothetical protein